MRTKKYSFGLGTQKPPLTLTTRFCWSGYVFQEEKLEEVLKSKSGCKDIQEGSLAMNKQKKIQHKLVARKL